MAITEKLQQRRLRYSTREITAERHFNIEGISPLDYTTGPLYQLGALFPLGQLWSVEPPNIGGWGGAEPIPFLAVVGYDYQYFTGSQAFGTVYYSTNRDSDIRFWWDVGATTLEIREPVDPDTNLRETTAFPNSRIHHLSFPVAVFNYVRRETFYGVYTNGELWPWASCPGAATCGWDEPSIGVATSQQQLVDSLAGKINLSGFLGYGTGAIKFEGATATPEGPSANAVSGDWEVFTVHYRFTRRPCANDWNWIHPDTGTPYQVLLRGNFNQLGLFWPRTRNPL